LKKKKKEVKEKEKEKERNREEDKVSIANVKSQDKINVSFIIRLQELRDHY